MRKKLISDSIKKINLLYNSIELDVFDDDCVETAVNSTNGSDNNNTACSDYPYNFYKLAP